MWVSSCERLLGCASRRWYFVQLMGGTKLVTPHPEASPPSNAPARARYTPTGKVGTRVMAARACLPTSAQFTASPSRPHGHVRGSQPGSQCPGCQPPYGPWKPRTQ
jgi:hypothetical protein